MKKHCYRCHGTETQEAELALHDMERVIKDSADALNWQDILDKLNAGEMPPEDEPRLSDDERRTLIAWLNHEIKAVVKAMKSTGGRPVVRRLNRLEYQNTMTDLLGIETNYTTSLPPEGLSLIHI